MKPFINSQRLKTLLSIAWPLIIANSFWNLQLTIDRIFLGAYSTESLGAAMTVMGVFWVPMALLQQTASYVTTFVAQYFGAQKKSQIGSSVWQAFYVSIVGGVAFLGLNFFTDDFFQLVGHSPVVQDLEVKYFNALGYSALPIALMGAISGFFTGLGQTKKVIGINFVALLFNVIFDYLFIFGNFDFPALGIAGAGYATSLSSYCGVIYGCYLIFNQKYETEYAIRSSRGVNFDLLKQFLKYGLPSGMQWALEGLAFTVFLILMGRVPNGESALASSSIAVTIMMLAILPSLGVAQAVLTLVGQKLGEKKPDQAEDYAWDGVKVSALYISLMGLSFYLVPEFYLSWFKNDQNFLLWEQVSKLTPEILKIVAIFVLFDSIYLNISFALKGAGDTRFVSLVALIIPWPFMVLPAYLFMAHENAVIISWRFVILYCLLVAGIIAWRFTQGKWKQMSVIEMD